MAEIRKAMNLDREAIRDVHLCAFEDEGQMVAMLAVNLLNEEENPETISLVGDIDGEVVGHAAFSPVTIEEFGEWKGYILAPLGVKPEFQRRQIGSALIRNGIERLSLRSADVLFVYGDPAYYSKFGFRADAASRYLPPYKLQYPFGWQAIVLDEKPSHESTMVLSFVAALRDPALW